MPVALVSHGVVVGGDGGLIGGGARSLWMEVVHRCRRRSSGLGVMAPVCGKAGKRRGGLGTSFEVSRVAHPGPAVRMLRRSVAQADVAYLSRATQRDAVSDVPHLRPLVSLTGFVARKRLVFF